MESVDVLGFLTTVLMIGMLFYGIPTCLDFKRKGTTGETSCNAFVLGYFNSGLWLIYGYFVRSPFNLFLCIVGTVLNIAYVIAFYVFSPNKKAVFNRTLGYTIFSLLSAYYCINILDPNNGELLIGFIASIANILFVAAPLFDLGTVMRTKSTECLPTTMVYGNLVLSLLNIWYGYLLNDIFFIIPNVIGITTSSMTVSLYVFYPAAHKVKQK